MKKNDQKLGKKATKDLYGIDHDVSLQSVNFATAENSYLNERSREEEKC